MFNPLATVKNIPSWVWLSGAAVVALYILKKGSVQAAVEGVAAAAVSGAGGVVVGGVKGLVLGAGDVIGVPRTSVDRCKNAIMRADNSGAFSYCSAGVFSRWQYLSVRKKLTGKTFTMSDIFN